MKYFIYSSIFILLFTFCEEKEKNKDVFIDNFSITIPEQFKENNLLSETAVLEYDNDKELPYITVLVNHDLKRNLDFNYSLDDYYNSVLSEKLNETGLIKGMVNNRSKVTVNDNEVVKFDMYSEIENVIEKQYDRIALLEGEKYFYQITISVPYSHRNDYLILSDIIINSFKENTNN